MKTVIVQINMTSDPLEYTDWVALVKIIETTVEFYSHRIIFRSICWQGILQNAVFIAHCKIEKVHDFRIALHVDLVNFRQVVINFTVGDTVDIMNSD